MFNEDYFPEFKIEERKGNNLPSGVLMRVSGPFGNIDTKNRNGRIYSAGLWEKVLKDEDTQRKLKDRNLFGEADHPQDLQASINRASHIITDLKVNGGNKSIDGTADVLDTPAGRIVQTLFKAGCKLGISSRGAGSIDEKAKSRGQGAIVSEDDYKFGGFDFVTDPSAQNAYPQVSENKILAEGVQTLLHEKKDEVLNDLNYYNGLLEKVGYSIDGAKLLTEGGEKRRQICR